MKKNHHRKSFYKYLYFFKKKKKKWQKYFSRINNLTLIVLPMFFWEIIKSDMSETSTCKVTKG